MATSDSPLSVPNVTLAVARPAGSGGGSEPVGAPSISSVTDNGDGTLSISGSNFGAKTQAAPVLVDYVDTAYEYGVENTFNSTQSNGVQVDNAATDRIWKTVLNGQLVSGGRAAGQSRVYRLFGDVCSLREPLQYEAERADGNRRMYCAIHAKYKQNSLHHRMTTDEYTVGTFIPEEVISINDGEYVGYYAGDISEPGNFVHSFRFNSASDIQPDKAELIGKTLVGQSSGASLTFPSDANWGSVYSNGLAFVRTRGPKFARIWDDPNGNGLRSSYAVGDSYLSTSADIRTYEDFNMRDYYQLVEFEIDLTVDGYWGYFVDRVAKGDQSFNGTTDVSVADPNYSLSLAQFGEEGDIDPTQEIDIAEVYFDKTRQRVYLGNASTFSACTHVELQRPTAWADDGVTAAKNLGTLSGGWVYVVGPGGAVNETGVAL